MSESLLKGAIFSILFSLFNSSSLLIIFCVFFYICGCFKYVLLDLQAWLNKVSWAWKLGLLKDWLSWAWWASSVFASIIDFRPINGHMWLIYIF
jgi:hypothetical protein